jgi:hypothetical protein
MAEKYTKNSPKVLNAEGKPLVPGTYELQKVVIRRDDLANELNITELITDISFTEELFSPVMVAKLTVSDTANADNKIFKSNPDVFQGHEVLEISIKFIDTKGDQTITFQLSVREYGDFELDSEGVYTGVFVITAVDDFAVLSRLQQISFAVGQPHDVSKLNKNTIEHVDLIFKKYLKLNNEQFDYSTTHARTNCDSKIRGVIPYCTPLQAIEWLRTKSFDQDKAPFFIYGIFNDLAKTPNSPVRKIIARSWNWLIDKKYNRIYRNFVKKYNNDDGSYTNDDRRYESEKQRILEFTTSVTKNELNKFLQGEYDTIVKTINYTGFFDYDDKKIDPYVPALSTTLSSTPNEAEYSERFDQNKKLREAYIKTLKLSADDITISQGAIISHRPLPLYDDSNGLNDTVQIKNWHSRAIRFFTAKIANEQSEIVVYGDINLNPGKIIDLIVDEDSELSTRNSLYIIIASVHSFVDGRYINRLRLVQLPKV